MVDMALSTSGQRRKMKAWRISNARRDIIIVESLNAGIPISEVAATMGVSRQHIYNLLKEGKQQWQASKR